jgi:hypothetical protein
MLSRSSRGAWPRLTAATGLAVLLGLGVVPTACGSDDDPGSGSLGAADAGSRDERSETTEDEDDGCDVVGASRSEPDSSVELTLNEYVIGAEPQQVAAGTVELVANNEGRIWHEVIVVRHDGDPGAFPLGPFGGADETQIPEDAIVGKLREFLAGTTCTASFDLAPGSYALICNLVDDGSNPHYDQGMYTGLTVT